MGKKKDIDFHQTIMSADDIREAVNFAGVGLYRCAVDGTIYSINSTAFYLFDLDKIYNDPSELKGVKLSDVLNSEESEKKIRSELQKTGFADNFIYEFSTVSGARKYVILNAFTYRDDYSGGEFVNAMIYDITETMNFKLKFENVNLKYQTIVESFDGYIYVCTPDYRISFMNEKLARKTGFPAETEKCYKILHGREEVCPWCVNQRVFQGETVHWEIQSPKDNRWYYVVSSPLLNKDATVSKLSISQDITSKKQAEKELRMLSAIPEQIAKGIAVRDFNGEFLFYNKYWARLHGINADTCNIKTMQDVYSTTLLDEFARINEKVFLSGYYYGEICYAKKGAADQFTFQLTCTLYKDEKGVPAGFVDVVTDITDKKILEKELMKVRDISNGYLDAALSLIVILDTKFKITYINKKGILLLGYDRHEIIGKNWFDSFIAREYRSTYKSIYQKAMTLDEISENEYLKGYIVTKSGELRLINFNNQFIRNINGEVESVFISGEDITEQAGMELMIRESEEKYRTLLENLNVGVYRISGDAYGKFIHANRAMLDIFGYGSLDEFFKLSIVELYCDPAERSLIYEKLMRDGYIRNHKFAARKKNGVPIIVSCNAKVIYDDNNRVKWIDGALEDITEQEKLNEEAQKNKKLESLKVVVGGIAHDFNNLLTGIFGYISMAKYYAEPESQVIKMLDESEKACNRAKELSSKMLLFSRFGKTPAKPICLNQIIVDTVQFALKNFNLSYEIHIEDGLWMIEIEELMFHQVIYNIVLNAAQASSDGGRITVSGNNFNLDASSNHACSIAGQPYGKYVKITVEDQGCGISENGLMNLYDPLYTAKNADCGLGLPAVFLILKKNSGFINIESAVGVGTKVEVYFPAKANVSVSEKTVSGKTGKKILIMDSDSTFRGMLANVLNRIGYAVTFASDKKQLMGELSVSQKCGFPFDIVIPDLKNDNEMEKLAVQLSAKYPNIKLIASCSDSRCIKSDALRSGYAGFIKKPFRVEQLIKILNSLEKQ